MNWQNRYTRVEPVLKKGAGSPSQILWMSDLLKLYAESFRRAKVCTLWNSVKNKQCIHWSLIRDIQYVKKNPLYWPPLAICSHSTYCRGDRGCKKIPVPVIEHSTCMQLSVWQLSTYDVRMKIAPVTKRWDYHQRKYVVLQTLCVVFKVNFSSRYRAREKNNSKNKPGHDHLFVTNFDPLATIWMLELL